LGAAASGILGGEMVKEMVLQQENQRALDRKQLIGLALAALAAIFGAVLWFAAGRAGATAVAAGPVVIDVRTAEEFAAGHITGAINIPLDAADFREQVAALNRDGDFIVHCGTGARADRVTDYMAEQGFGSLASLSLEEALELADATVTGDLEAAALLNPTTNENTRPDGPPRCALTGESLFGVTRP